MKILSSAFIICSACLFSGCDGASMYFNDKSPASLKFAASFQEGKKIALADPGMAPRSVNGVMVFVGIVPAYPDSYDFKYNLWTYSTEAHVEIKSISIDGLSGPISSSTGDLKIGPMEPLPGVPMSEAHRAQGMHMAGGFLVKGIKKDVLAAAVKRSGQVKVVASVKVVNNDKTEERDIVYIFEVERRLDF